MSAQMPRLSLEQQLPRYTPEQAQRRTEIMAKIAAETDAYRQRVAPYETELSEIWRKAL